MVSICRPLRSFVISSLAGAGLLAAAHLTSNPVRAEEVVRTSPYAKPLPVELRDQDGRLLLELEEAIVIALRNNIGLQVERYARAQAYENIRRGQGVFDLGLNAAVGLFSEESPAASTLEGAVVRKAEGANFDFGVDQLVSTGGTASLDLTNDRAESNSIFAGVNPSYTTNLDFSYAQPLLRSAGKLATQRNIIVARTNSEISYENLILGIINTLERVESTYWSLVETRQQIEVALESLELAKELDQMNRIQVEVGTLAPLELTQSAVGVATREEALLRARALADDTADTLRQLLNLEDDRYWDMPLVPSTDPVVERVEIDTQEAIAEALDKRSELRQQRLRIENLRVDEQFQKNLSRARLDFQARYGFNGLGGTVVNRNPFDPDSPVEIIPGGYEDALQQVLDTSFTGWSAGLVFAKPLQNRQGKASVAIAELALDQGETSLSELELAIRTEVRRTVRAVETAAEAIDLATVSRELAEKQLDAEQKRYENGLSTSFEVLLIQEDLSEARSREVSSITAYRRTLVLYHKAIGRLLEHNGILIEDDLADDEN